MSKKMTERELCDLTCECAKLAGLPVKRETKEFLHCSAVRMRISEAESELVGRPAGNYSSIFFGDLWRLDGEAREEISDTLAHELRRLLLGVTNGKKAPRILVVGLGNGEILHDSFGDRVCRELLPHDGAAVFAVGVPAKSGLESAALVKSLALCADADAVLAVDSLVARGEERVGRVIQLSDSGIIPASGVGKSAAGLTRENIGKPVVALGIPSALKTEGHEGYLAVPETLLYIISEGAVIVSRGIQQNIDENTPKTEQWSENSL